MKKEQKEKMAFDIFKDAMNTWHNMSFEEQQDVCLNIHQVYPQAVNDEGAIDINYAQALVSFDILEGFIKASKEQK